MIYINFLLEFILQEIAFLTKNEKLYNLAIFLRWIKGFKMQIIYLQRLLQRNLNQKIFFQYNKKKRDIIGSRYFQQRWKYMYFYDKIHDKRNIKG